MPHLRLQDAFLCLDCETIATNPTQCVVCTSKAVHPLASFLNRPGYREVLRDEIMQELIHDPANTAFGMKMSDVYRLVLEHQSKTAPIRFSGETMVELVERIVPQRLDLVPDMSNGETQL